MSLSPQEHALLRRILRAGLLRPCADNVVILEILGHAAEQAGMIVVEEKDEETKNPEGISIDDFFQCEFTES